MISKIKNWFFKEHDACCNYVSFSKMYIIFVLGSFLGTIYEEIIGFVKHYHIYGVLFWPTRKGVIYGPFNPLYGAGIVFILLLLGRKKRSPAKTFLFGALLGGAIEYIVSLLMELVLGIVSWDYSNRPFNIHGRTTLLYMIFWGFSVMLLIHIVYPYLSKLIDKIPKKINKILVPFLVIFMTFDMIVSWTALGRQILRNNGYPPYTVVGEFYDKVFPDERLKKVYTNMKFIK